MNPKKKSRRYRASVSIQALDLAISRFIHSLGCNVPLFKKLWDIIFFWDNNFLSHFSGHFEGASTRLKKLLSHKKNYVPQFLKQQDINS
jgi:hypothetical protein